MLCSSELALNFLFLAHWIVNYSINWPKQGSLMYIFTDITAPYLTQRPPPSNLPLKRNKPNSKKVQIMNNTPERRLNSEATRRNESLFITAEHCNTLFGMSFFCMRGAALMVGGSGIRKNRLTLDAATNTDEPSLWPTTARLLAK